MNDLFCHQPAGGYVEAGAVLSPDGRYRYRLWREWRGCGSDDKWEWMRGSDGGRVVDGEGQGLGWPKACAFIMLNPSTADGDVDDPTIRRCVAFAKAWRFDRLEVVNLFAYRATHPRALFALSHEDDPVGWENQSHVEQAVADAALIVCAWGTLGSHIAQDETMLGWLGRRKRFALGLTRDGHPRHPLYVPSATPLVEFRP